MIHTLNSVLRVLSLATFFVVSVLGSVSMDAAPGFGSTFGEAPDPPVRSYYVYVCAESDDQVALVRYGPKGVELEEVAHAHVRGLLSEGRYRATTTRVVDMKDVPAALRDLRERRTMGRVVARM